jgi:AcrR family transcriptional regulator
MAVPEQKIAEARSTASRRDAIIESATRLFAERGYEGASLRDIAAAADVRLGLIDYHFGAKPALFVEVLSAQTPSVAAGLDASLDRVIAAAPEGRPDLASVVSAYVDTYWQGAVIGSGWRDYCRLLYDVIRRPDRMELAAGNLAFTDHITDRYRSALAALMPGVSDEDLRAGFRLIGLATLGLIVHITAIRPPDDVVAQRRRSLLTFCIGGLTEVAALGASSCPRHLGMAPRPAT